MNSQALVLADSKDIDHIDRTTGDESGLNATASPKQKKVEDEEAFLFRSTQAVFSVIDLLSRVVKSVRSQIILKKGMDAARNSGGIMKIPSSASSSPSPPISENQVESLELVLKRIPKVG